MFCVRYTPKDKPVDPNNIQWKIVKADTMKDAVKKFNDQYPGNRALCVSLYVTKM